jgi:large subunit ribosomal protein L19e
MKLDNKKELAARTLGVGKKRIVFNTERLEEVKELLTKQDVRDLVKDGAIIVKDIRGSKVKVKKKTKRKDGSVKKRVNTRKRDYMLLTRKLRAYVAEMRKQKKITDEDFIELRKEIRASAFRSKSHMKERIDHIIKEKK